MARYTIRQKLPLRRSWSFITAARTRFDVVLNDDHASPISALSSLSPIPLFIATSLIFVFNDTDYTTPTLVIRVNADELLNNSNKF